LTPSRTGRDMLTAWAYAGLSDPAPSQDSTSVVGAPWIAGIVPSRPAW